MNVEAEKNKRRLQVEATFLQAANEYRDERVVDDSIVTSTYVSKIGHTISEKNKMRLQAVLVKYLVELMEACYHRGKPSDPPYHPLHSPKEELFKRAAMFLEASSFESILFANEKGDDAESNRLAVDPYPKFYTPYVRLLILMGNTDDSVKRRWLHWEELRNTTCASKKNPVWWAFMDRPRSFQSEHIGCPLSLRMRLAIVRLCEPFSNCNSEIQYLLALALFDLTDKDTTLNVQHALFMDILLQNLA